MSVMDKLGGIFRMDADDDDDGFYDSDAEEYLDEEPQTVLKKPIVNKADSDTTEKKTSRISSPKTSRRAMGNGMEVCVVKPTVFEESREITETLLSNRTVVLNLEGLNVEIAQRIIDFASGSCFAMRGNLQKISNYIFIITPPSVDVSGDFSELISGTLDVEITR